MKEIQCLEEALDFYRDRITGYNEEELDEERETFFAKIATSLQNGSVLEDGAPQFMPPRAKKARGGPYESKGELLMSLNQTTRMHIGMAASRDPDLIAACAHLTQRADMVQQNPIGQFGELLAACTDEQFEKIISPCSSTNNVMKFDHLARALLKAIFDLVQVRELQNTHAKNAALFLMQQMVAGSFANEHGVVNWATEGNSVQSFANVIYKEKCKRTGAAEAEARREAAEAEAAREGGAMPM